MTHLETGVQSRPEMPRPYTASCTRKWLGPTLRPYFPDRHHRRSIRLPGYDYRSPGSYFVTVVSANRDCFFEQLRFRHVIEECWLAIPRHAAHASLDAWVVMPNHIHGVIIVDWVGAKHFPPTAQRQTNQGATVANETAISSRPEMPRPRRRLQPGSLGAIIGSFKSVTTRRMNRIRRTPGAAVWQRNYYERIVRSQRELERIREYIATNPARWALDRENPQRKDARDEWNTEEDVWFSAPA